MARLPLLDFPPSGGPTPRLAYTCLQRHRDVLLPVAPDHRGAPCLQSRHQRSLLRLLLQPVADILGPQELLSLMTSFRGHKAQECLCGLGEQNGKSFLV